MTQDLGYFSPELAAVIGLKEAVIFNKLQWCVENPQMGGTISDDGLKMIRNPIACTNPRKLNKSHGKQVDWLGNFIWATAGKLRRIFARLEAIGLVVTRKLRAHNWDQCKYYSINYNKLAELLKGAPLSICSKPTNRFDGNDRIDLTTADKSYQDTFSTEVIQILEREGNAIEVLEENLDASKNLSLRSNTRQDCSSNQKSSHEDQYSAPAESAKNWNETELREFQSQLEDLGKRLGRKSPVAWAFTIVQNLQSGTPCTYWEEFRAGVPLGTSEQREWETAPGVPCAIAIQCLEADFLSRPGTTPQEAARKAAQVISRPKEMAAVWETVKARVVFQKQEWERQSALGVQTPVVDSWLRAKPSVSVEEAAIALHQMQSALPLALQPSDESSSLPPVAETVLTVDGSVTDVASTADEVATAAKATIWATLSKFARPCKKRSILEANIAEVKKLVPVVAVAKEVKCNATVEDEEEIW